MNREGPRTLPVALIPGQLEVMRVADMKKTVDEMGTAIDFEKNDYQLNLDTSLGPMRLRFFPDVAPGHCRNMLALAKAGFYDNLTFHRIISGFMIQGGCPTGNGTGGPGYQIKAEFNQRRHRKGTLSMARAQDPNSAGSQFFVCLEDVPYLDGQYTVFGELLDEESTQTLDRIGAVRTGAQDRPVEPVMIRKAAVAEKPL